MLHLQSDDRLVQLARLGCEPAFEALVRRYRDPLLDYGRGLLVSTPAAEDAVQQGLLQAWIALQRGTVVHEVRPWLYRIVRNAALRMASGCGNNHAELSDSLEAARTLEAEFEQRVAVRGTLEGLAALPPLQRAALLATAIDGTAHAQVAETLGLSESAVRGLVYRARKALRAAATALTPFPVATWIAREGRRGLPLAERLSELGSAPGASGLIATLAKSGAIVGATVALIAGGATVRSRLLPPVARAAGSTALATLPSVAPANSRSASSPGDKTRPGSGRSLRRSPRSVAKAIGNRAGRPFQQIGSREHGSGEQPAGGPTSRVTAPPAPQERPVPAAAQPRAADEGTADGIEASSERGGVTSPGAPGPAATTSDEAPAPSEPQSSEATVAKPYSGETSAEAPSAASSTGPEPETSEVAPGG